MADDLGSFDWGRRSGGRLTHAERRIVRRAALRDLARSAPGLIAGALGRRGAGRASLDVLDVPDTPLARRVETVALRAQSPAIVGHAMRTVAFGHAVGALDGVEADTELMWCASLLHDVAIERPTAGTCFAVRGGEIALETARDAGASTETGELLADAVCRHVMPGIDPARAPLAYLVSQGALVDVLASRLHQLDRRFVGDVLAAHPRGDFASVVSRLWRAETRAVPDGRPAVIQRTVCFSVAARWAPLRDPRPVSAPAPV